MQLKITDKIIIAWLVNYHTFTSVCGHLTLTLYLLAMYFVRCLLLTFASSLDLDQVRQNIGPGIYLNWNSDDTHQKNFEN